MTLSIVFGTAFQVGTDEPDDDRVRDYRTSTGHFVGHDSTDIAHVCDDRCRDLAIPDEYEPDAHRPGQYVSVHPFKRDDNLTYVRTADVVDFDPGDDPYIRCIACGNPL